jgi:hypothetical protein
VWIVWEVSLGFLGEIITV